jgi:hypothetical protein
VRETNGAKSAREANMGNVFIYSPKSGSKVLADHGVAVVTLNNGSHIVAEQTATVVCGNGSRDQRARFGRVAETVCSVFGGVAVDERGALAVHTHRPCQVAAALSAAGIAVDHAQAWSWLATGHCTADGAESWLSGGGLPAEVQREPTALDLIVQWSPREDRPERPWLWTYGSAAWRTGGRIDFDIYPAPASVRGIPTGDRDWWQLASCMLVAPLATGETYAGLAAGWFASHLRSLQTECLSGTRVPPRRGNVPPRRGNLRAIWRSGELIVADQLTGETAMLIASPGEVIARQLVLGGGITAEEAQALTGVSASGCADDSDACVGLSASDEPAVWTAGDGAEEWTRETASE